MAIGKENDLYGQEGSLTRLGATAYAMERQKNGPYIFSVGEVVCLKSGGLGMTVTEHLAPARDHGVCPVTVACEWLDTIGVLHRADFAVTSLRVKF